jgi:hypothetical protein
MLDAGFLQAEDADRHVSLAIGAVAVLAGPMPDFDELAVGLVERILSACSASSAITMPHPMSTNSRTASSGRSYA